MIRRFAFLWLVIIANVCSAQDRDDYALLWRYSNDLGQSGYLFGTMHLNTDQVYDFSDSVLVCLKNCDIAAFEIDLGLVQGQMAAEVSQVLEQKYGFKSMFEEALSESLKAETDSVKQEVVEIIEQKRTDYETARRTMTKDQKAAHGTFLDAYLFEYAKGMGLECVGLEDYYEHIDLYEQTHARFDFDSTMYQPDSIPDLENWIEEYSPDSAAMSFALSFRSTLQTFTDIYHRGDLNEIAKWSESDYFRSDVDLLTMEGRNIIMLNSILDHLENGSVFAAVGCAHLPGELGLIALLKDHGFKVDVVEATFQGQASEMMEEFETRGFKEPSAAGNSGFELYVPNGFEKVENKTYLPIDIYLSHDQLNEQLFMVGVFGKDFKVQKEMLLEAPGEQLAAGFSNAKFIRDEVIETENGPCRQLMFDAGGVACKFRYIFRDDRCAFLGIVGEKFIDMDTPGATQFFNDITYNESAAEETSYTMFIDTIGAMKAMVPPVVYNEVLSERLPNTEYEDYSMYDPYEMHMVSCVDYNSGSAFILRYSDMPAGLSSMANEDIVSELLMAFDQDLEFELEKQWRDTLDFGEYLGIRQNLLGTRGEIVKAMVICRGNRTYMAIGAGQKAFLDRIDGFFDSFSLLELENHTLSWQGSDEGKFSIQAPGSLKKVEEHDQEYSIVFPNDSTWVWATNDSLSGAQLAITKNRISPDFLVVDAPKLLRDHIEEFRGWNDSLTTAIDTTFYGSDAVMQRLYAEDTEIVTDIFCILEDDEVWNISYSYPIELASRGDFGPILDSLHIYSFDLNKPLQGSLSDVLNWAKSDSLEDRNKAHEYLEFWQVQSDDLEELNDAFLEEYQEVDHWLDIDQQIFDLIATLDSSKLYDLAQLKFNLSNDHEDKENWAREFIILTDDQESMDSTVAVLNRWNPEEELDVLYHFYDSLSLAVQLVNSLDQAAENRFIQEDIIDLFLHYGDSAEQMFLRDRPDWIDAHFEICLAATDTMSDENWRGYTYKSRLSNMAKLYRTMDLTDRRIEMLKNAMDIESLAGYYLVNVAATLELWDQKVSKKFWKEAIENHSMRYDILETLRSINMTELVKSEFYEPEMYYGAWSFSYMEEDWWIEEYSVHSHQETEWGTVVIYEMTGEEGLSYCGFGPLPDDLSLDGDELWKRIFFSDYYEEGIEVAQHIESILQSFNADMPLEE